MGQQQLTEQYVATGLDACHKRIAELETALLQARDLFEVIGEVMPLTARRGIATIERVLK